MSCRSFRVLVSPVIVFVFFVTNLPVPFVYAVTAEELLANPSQADPFTTDVPKLREELFDLLKKQETEIVQKHVRETGIPWKDSAGEVYTSHPRYQQATKEYAQVWQQHMEKVRALDSSLRERGMNQILDRAKELAKKDGIPINWSEEFKPSGTDPWKGRGAYTDAEYTGTDRANRYVRQALQEKNLPVTSTPGQNNTQVKSWDLNLWGEEGKGKIHKAFGAENPEFAKSASPLGKTIPLDKQTAALETLKKAHLERPPPQPGTWQEYQRMSDLAKAVERGEQNVLGTSPSDPRVRDLNKIRSMETDPVTAGLKKLGDERGLQGPQGQTFRQNQMQRLSEIMKTGQEANKTFLTDLDKKIQQAEANGDLKLANEIKVYKNEALQQQILQQKAMINKLGQQRYVEVTEGTRFELVPDPDTGKPMGGKTVLFRDAQTGEAMTKLEMMEKYRNVIKRIEENQAAGLDVKYRNQTTKQVMKDAELLDRARQIIKNLEEGKYAEAAKLTEYEPIFQKGKGLDVKRAEYEVIYESAPGRQKMYRNVKTGETITEAEMQKRYIKKPLEDLRKQMNDLGPKQPKASFAGDDFSFEGINEKAFQPLKNAELPKIREGVFPPARAKNIKLVYQYAKLAEKYFQKKYPQLGSQPEGAFWLADPAEAIEEYLLEAERKMSRHPDILKAFRAAKKDILRNYVRTQLQHQKDAVMIAQEEYIKASKERTILRARKMARDAEFNESLQKAMFTLLAASKLVDFLQTWYDEGFDALVRKSVSFLTIEIPAGMAFAKGTGLLMSYLAMNSPGLCTLLQGVMAYMGAAGVGMMVLTIGRGIAYMTTDYFILDENRQTLIRSLCPFPPEKKNPWDLWTWLAEKRNIDVEKDFTPILDALTSPNTKWTTAMSDIQEYAAQLVTMYRIWLTENHDYVRRLRYFEDDPKVWNVIAGELAKRIWLVNKAVEFKEAQEDEAREQRAMEDEFFTRPPEEIPAERQAVIYSVSINGSPVDGYFKDFIGEDHYVHKALKPVPLKAGQEMKVAVEYVVLALPGDSIKVRIEPSCEEGYSVASEKEKAVRGALAVEQEGKADDEFGCLSGKAEFSLPLQYPSEKKNNSEELYDSTLKLSLSAENKFLFDAVIQNAFTVEGPGTDFNGRGNLEVTVKVDEADIKDIPADDLPDVTITLEPLSGQTEVPAPVKGIPLRGAHNFENIQLGQWRVIAELEKKEIEKAEAQKPVSGAAPAGSFITVTWLLLGEKEVYAAEYSGPGKGEKLVTLFMPRPMGTDVPLTERHAGNFKVEVELGRFDVKEFVKIKHKQTDLTAWNILVLVQDQGGNPVIGAEVVTLGGNRIKAEEIGDGLYLLKGLSPMAGTVRVGAEVSAQLMRAVAAQQYHGEAQVTFNNSSQENITIVITGLAQYQWLIRGTAQYSDGSPLFLLPDDEMTITMGGEEKWPKTVVGASYSFGPFPVPPDSGADNPAFDSNSRGLRAEIRRRGALIAVASGVAMRKGQEETEYNIPFQAVLKNMIEPKREPPPFVNVAPPPVVLPPQPPANMPAPIADEPQEAEPPPMPPVVQPKPVQPVQPVQPSGNNECKDANGRPTLFCNTFNGQLSGN